METKSNWHQTSNNGKTYQECSTVMDDGDVEAQKNKKARVNTNDTTLGKKRKIVTIGLISTGILVIILMVLYGINNISYEDGSVVVGEKSNQTETIEKNNTNEPELLRSIEPQEQQSTFDPRATLDMLDSSSSYEYDDDDDEAASSLRKDVVITNKTVTINGENESIIITS
jgi:hypothetical protein